MDLGTVTYYSIDPRMLNLVANIHHRLGEIHARHLQHSPPDLARAYRVSAVHANVAIEGGMLEHLPELDPFLAHDLRQAHALLMHGLATDAGHFRTGPMDVLYGDPEPLRSASAHDLPAVVQDLLRYAEEDDFPPLITSCVVHFGLIYLRPFTAGNGRLARLWQRRILMRHWSVFGYLPYEAFIHRAEPAYHAALEYADRRGDCGGFIVYLLERLDEALAEVLDAPDPVRKPQDRLHLFLQQWGERPFRRKDYLTFFPELSTATATRDLMEASADGRVKKSGEVRTAVYRAGER